MYHSAVYYIQLGSAPTCIAMSARPDLPYQLKLMQYRAQLSEKEGLQLKMTLAEKQKRIADLEGQLRALKEQFEVRS